MDIKQKIYDLKNQQKTLTEKMAAKLDKGELGEDYTALEKEFDGLQAQVDACEKQLAREAKFGSAPERKDLVPEEKEIAGGVLKGLKPSVVKSFAQGVRKAMNEGAGSAGGYTVPEDIATRIYTLIEAEESLLDYVTNESVTTDTGKRTYKTRAQHSGFSTAAEAAKIAKVGGPTFAQVSYTIAKRGGILPVTNELLDDTDENLTAIILQWFADEARATINKNVAAKLVQTSPTEITDLKSILTVLTTGLGSALRAVATIHTNDAGLLFLSTLVDGQGRPMLQPNPSDLMRMALCVGPVAVPIKTWDETTLPNTSDGKVPFGIGSIKEGIFRFDRRQLTITQSSEASIVSGSSTLNAFEEDLTLFRGVMRDDYQVRDSGAFKYCLYDPSPAAAPDTPGGNDNQSGDDNQSGGTD